MRLIRGVVNIVGAWLNILRACFARECLSTPLLQILGMPLYTSNTLAIEVGEALLKQTTWLLPSIYEKLCNKLPEITRLHGIIVSQDIHRLVSANGLRSQLSSLLEHYLAYKCSFK